MHVTYFNAEKFSEKSVFGGLFRSKILPNIGSCVLQAVNFSLEEDVTDLQDTIYDHIRWAE